MRYQTFEKNPESKCKATPRHVQIVLRTFKARVAVAFIKIVEDPHEAVRKWMEREKKGLNNVTYLKEIDENKIRSEDVDISLK